MASKMLTNIMSSVPPSSPSKEGGLAGVRTEDRDLVSLSTDILHESNRRMSIVSNDGQNGHANGHAATANSDVYSQLAQKETDLILAAELGKALLEKNQELKRNNDAMAGGYEAKIEVGNCIDGGVFKSRAKTNQSFN